MQQYLETFRNHVDVIEQYGGNIGHNDAMLSDDEIYQGLAAGQQTAAKKTEAYERCKQKYLAYAFIAKADNENFGKLKEDLENDYAKGSNHYPTQLTDAYSLLSNFKQYKKKTSSSSQTGASFHNNGSKSSKSGKKMSEDEYKKFKAGQECRKCGKKGHYSYECPSKKEDNNQGHNNLNNSGAEGNVQQGSTHLNFTTDESYIGDGGFCFNQHPQEEGIKDWILLDNQSTVDIFCNARLLKNIREVSGTMNINTNGGVLKTSQMGELKGYGMVWYHPEALTNILSLAKLSNKYRITYDSNGADRFTVHKKDRLIHFYKSPTGLYFHDTRKRAITLLNTVAENVESHTAREVEQAKLARKIQAMVGYPSDQDFMKMVESNQLINCPISTKDISNANDIFGRNVGNLKGKTTRKVPEIVVSDYLPPPENLLKN